MSSSAANSAASSAASATRERARVYVINRWARDRAGRYTTLAQTYTVKRGSGRRHAEHLARTHSRSHPFDLVVLVADNEAVVSLVESRVVTSDQLTWCAGFASRAYDALGGDVAITDMLVLPWLLVIRAVPHDAPGRERGFPLGNVQLVLDDWVREGSWWDVSVQSIQHNLLGGKSDSYTRRRALYVSASKIDPPA